MDHFGEQPKFEIKPSIEQKPFESPAVQSFFSKWCEVNDSISPQIVGRGNWEKRGVKGVLEKRPDGKQTLFLPEDLQLWEMVGVMEVIDHDTFSAKPERQNEKKEELRRLGKLFQNSGVYIAQRLEGITDGREIAQALAEKFYEYGKSLESGKQPDVSATLEDIRSNDLNPEELEEVDRFLAGEHLYGSRRARVDQVSTTGGTNQDEQYEKERRKTLAQFFRVSRKAFELKQKTEHGEFETIASGLKPWQKDASIHNAFLEKVERTLTKKIETPKIEFEMAIFRRGMEKLVGEMKERGWKHGVNSFFEKLGLNLRFEQRKIADTLHIPHLRAELETIRESGNVKQLSALERKIADKIQQAVGSFPCELSTDNPAEIVANQYINCVGASTLGGALMKEAGLDYLVGDVPKHSILFLVTSDGQVEWRDMLSISFNELLTDEMIKGQRKDGQPLTVADIVAFSQKPTPEGLRFDIDSEEYRNKLQWVGEGQEQYVTVFEPEYGQQIQVLNNTGNALSDLGRKEEAIEAYRQAVAVDPKFAYPYNGLGNALSDLGRKEEAIEAYRQAVAVDPKFAYPYNGLGNALSDLGRKEEAIEAYRQFIDLADKKGDDYWIKRAERIISELKK